MSLTALERAAIRDSDEQYLGRLGDALSMASGAVYDGMLAAGLRIVREDRDDPPMDELVARIATLIRNYEERQRDGYATSVSIRDVLHDLRSLRAEDAR